MDAPDIFIHDFGFALGDIACTVEESAAAGRLRSRAEDLRDAGFDRHHLCSPAHTAYDLAHAAVRDLPGARAADTLIYATCLPQNGNLAEPARFAASRDVKDLMDFPASRLQVALGLEHALVLGLTQQACTGFLGSLRLARALLLAEPERARVLCVTSDRFPPGALYEQSYNLISDGAAACLVSRERRGLRLLAWHGLTNGALAQASDDETVGTFFAYATRVIGETLARARVDAETVDWVVPQNTHGRAWPVLARLTGLRRARIFDRSRADVGHVVSGDNVINLERLIAAGQARPGQRVLLFMAGYGLNAQATLLEVV
jgi:3-oxoacyl-[acyl-carrier-protein] synthase-3